MVDVVSCLSSSRLDEAPTLQIKGEVRVCKRGGGRSRSGPAGSWSVLQNSRFIISACRATNAINGAKLRQLRNTPTPPPSLLPVSILGQLNTPNAILIGDMGLNAPLGHVLYAHPFIWALGLSAFRCT